MKCDTLVVYVQRGKKKPKMVPSLCIGRYHRDVERWLDHNPDIAKDAVPCDGDIIAEVKAVDEAGWGYSHAVFEVNYKCNKCGMTYFPELPSNDDQVSEALTKYIASFSEEDRAKILEEKAIQYKKYQEDIERTRKDMERRRRK